MPRRVGLFVVSAEDDYHRLMAEGAVAAARPHGIPVDVFSADNTPGRQASDILRFVTDNVDDELTLLVVPLSDARHGGAIETEPYYKLASRVLARGADWVTLNHGDPVAHEALRARFPDRRVAMVVIDNEEFGRIQARQVQAVLPSGARVVYVVGNLNDTAAQERRRGFFEVLASGAIAVEEIDGWWRPEVAHDNALRWITSPLRRHTAVHAVVGQDDDMARAARTALTEAAARLRRPELAKLPAFGGDGLPDKGELWVEEGALTATVRVTLPGAPAIEALVAAWSGGSLTPVTTLTPVAHPLPSRLRRIASTSTPEGEARTAPAAASADDAPRGPRASS